MLALTSYIYTTIGFLYYTQQSTYQLLGWLERHHFPLVSFFIRGGCTIRSTHVQKIVSPTFLLVFAHMNCFPCLI